MTAAAREDAADDHDHSYDPDDHEGHGHTHGLVDRSIIRSRAGVKAVALSLAVLGLAAIAQLLVFLLSSSVALLADLIHNFGTHSPPSRSESPSSSAASTARSSPG